LGVAKNDDADACGNSAVGGFKTPVGVATFTWLKMLRAFTLKVRL
jgi:hypothetical protein